MNNWIDKKPAVLPSLDITKKISLKISANSAGCFQKNPSKLLTKLFFQFNIRGSPLVSKTILFRCNPIVVEVCTPNIFGIFRKGCYWHSNERRIFLGLDQQKRLHCTNSSFLKPSIDNICTTFDVQGKLFLLHLGWVAVVEESRKFIKVCLEIS